MAFAKEYKISAMASIVVTVIAAILLPWWATAWVLVGEAIILLTFLHLYEVNKQKSKLVDDTLLKTVLKYASNGAILITDKNGNIIRTNEAVNTLTDKVGTGRKVDDLFDFTDSDKNPAPLFSASSPIVGVSSFDRTFTLDQTQHSARIKVVPFPDTSDSKVGRFMVIINDISNERSLEDQRNEFISITSHELRTPLTIAMSSLSMAQRAKDNAQMRQDGMDTAQKALDRLKTIINQLSVLADAQTGVLDVDITSVNMAELLQKQLEKSAQAAKNKTIELKMEIKPDTAPVFTSERRVNEIIQIYLENALKYTKEGSITVKAERSDDGGVTVSVQDTGVGIPIADQDKIFTEFYQVDDVLSRSADGIGLGLYITKQLAARLNGNVWLSSEPGVGSTFFLHIPQYSRQSKDARKVLDASLGDVSEAIL